MIEGRVTVSNAVAHPTIRGLFGGMPVALAQQEAGEHAAAFLGLPLWLWQLVNLILFLGVMLYFVARPLAAMFRRNHGGLYICARLIAINFLAVSTATAASRQ